MLLRLILCLSFLSALTLGMPKKGKGAGGRRANVPYFLLENSGDPCDKAIEDDEETKDIVLLSGPWAQVCDSKDQNKHICALGREVYSAGKKENPDFGVDDIDLYGEHKEAFRSKVVECRLALEKQEEKKKKQAGRKNVVYFRLQDKEGKCTDRRTELIYPNDLEVGPRQEAVKECDDVPVCILDRVSVAKIFQANDVTEDNLSELWNKYHEEFEDEDPATYSWQIYKKRRGC